MALSAAIFSFAAFLSLRQLLRQLALLEVLGHLLVEYLFQLLALVLALPILCLMRSSVAS